MIAPQVVSFFSEDGKHLGTRHGLRQEIHEITNIPVRALTGASLDSFSIDERLSWSERRYTTREEDMAYCLLGIFGVFTYLNYGEGQNNAFRRLKKAIEKDLRESAPILEANVSQRGRSTFDNLSTYRLVIQLCTCTFHLLMLGPRYSQSALPHTVPQEPILCWEERRAGPPLSEVAGGL